MSKDPLQFRKTLHSVYSFVRSVEVNRAIANLTLDHLIQAQMERIKGGATRNILDSKGESLGSKIPQIEVLTVLEQDINAAVAAVDKAGNDPQKLEELGIYTVDQTSFT